MIYTVTYLYAGEESLTREYDNIEGARKEVNSLSGDERYSRIQILVPLDALEAQEQYKEKFEELYDHLLKGSGIRGSKETVKKMI